MGTKSGTHVIEMKSFLDFVPFVPSDALEIPLMPSCPSL